MNNTYMYFSVEINGVLYNAEKLDLGNYDNMLPELGDLISFRADSGDITYISANVYDTELKVRLSPSEAQKKYIQKTFIQARMTTTDDITTCGSRLNQIKIKNISGIKNGNSK